MSDLEQARVMLLMAQKDLKALKGMLDVETFAEEVFGFHAQQASEKALSTQGMDRTFGFGISEEPRYQFYVVYVTRAGA